MKRMRVRQHFGLDDDGRTVLMNEFDRVLDGDDLAAALAVDEVDHVIERRGLAGAGRPGDQDQPIGTARQFIDLWRQAQGFTSGDRFAAKTETYFGVAVATVDRHTNPSGRAMVQGN